ncbi:hypothetical protein AM500_19095 [Bacillus sp. FJAT-18017]|nr:hypothetical protein AM500_19095 [Bacillus sp. FJAT-18017]
MIAKLDCECTVLTEKDSNSIMRKYQEALQDGKKEGYTPLIIIPSEMMVEILDSEEDLEYPKDSRESIIKKAKEIDAGKLLKELLEEVMPLEDDEEEDIAGEFSIEDQVDSFLSVEEADGKEIILAKIPTNKPWEVAAWVPMGGFNECPMPEQQVAVFQYWYEKYRAIPALVTSDVWEFYVENPPRTQEEAERLAWEQFGFCSDIVWQGTGSVMSLAGTLINSSVWYFWWD